MKCVYTGHLELPLVVANRGREWETDAEGVVDLPEELATNLLKQNTWELHKPAAPKTLTKETD